MTNLQKQFRKWLSLNYPAYEMTHQDDDSMSFKMEIPAQNASCSAAGCLLLLGVVPGIIYLLIAHQDAKIATLILTESEDSYGITGNGGPVSSVSAEFTKFYREQKIINGEK